jgi:hypothetical protein
VVALAIGLVALSATLTAAVITCGIWLHSANADRLNAADLIDGQRKLVAEYKHKYDAESVAHTVTTAQLAQEKQLRAVAEAQRNEAQRKCRAYLARSLKDATEDDINAALADLFAVSLAVVPPPGPRRSDSAADYLIDPASDV